MSKRSIGGIVGLFVAGLVFWLAQNGVFRVSLTPSEAQFVSLPIVAVALLFFKSVPRVVVIAPLLAGLLLVGLGSSVHWYDQQALLVSRLENDQLEVRTRKLREAINNSSQIVSGAARARSLRHRVSSAAEARDFLERFPENLGVLWGESKWGFISFPIATNRSISKLLRAVEFSGAADFILIESVPLIGLPLSPRSAASSFIASLTSGLSTMSSSWITAEIQLKDAATLKDPKWRTAEHRAFPWWLLGNLYLRRAIEVGAGEPGYLECSKQAYQKAAGMVSESQNPELRAAVHNNMAIASYIESAAFESSLKTPEATEQYKLALNIFRSNKSPFNIGYRSAQVPLQNLKILKNANRKLHKLRKQEPRKEAGKRKRRKAKRSGLHPD